MGKFLNNFQKIKGHKLFRRSVFSLAKDTRFLNNIITTIWLSELGVQRWEGVENERKNPKIKFLRGHKLSYLLSI